LCDETYSVQKAFSQENLDAIKHSCLNLEILSICIERSRGDREEVALYQTIGSLSRLTSLELTLSTHQALTDSVPTVDSRFDEYEKTILGVAETRQLFLPHRGRNITSCIGHVRSALINSAVDEKLAVQIAQAISSGKPKDGSAFNLQRIILTINKQCTHPGAAEILPWLTDDFTLQAGFGLESGYSIITKNKFYPALPRKFSPSERYEGNGRKIVESIWPE